MGEDVVIENPTVASIVASVARTHAPVPVPAVNKPTPKPAQPQQPNVSYSKTFIATKAPVPAVQAVKKLALPAAVMPAPTPKVSIRAPKAQAPAPTLVVEVRAHG